MSEQNNTPNPEERARIVADALSKVSPTFRPDQTTDGELILQKAMEVSKAVNALIKPFIIEANTKLGVTHDKKVLSTMIGKKYLEGFGTWSKDELLYLLVFIHTQIAIESITGETGSKNIITPI